MLKKIQIALYGRDEYMSHLAEYICCKGHNMLETRLFTNFDMLCESAKKGRIDVLLAGEEVIEEIRLLKNKISQIMLLSEGNQVSECSEFYLLYKYQSAQNLVKEVLVQIAEDDTICCTQKLALKRSVELIGVYAPYGGAGTTEYARTMAEEFSKHFKTLYINLELFQGLSFLSGERKAGPGQFERGMSEVVFYLKQRKEKLALKLETVIAAIDGLDYIFAVEDYRDLYSLSCEDMSRFIKVLLQETEYERVVFDIGYLNDSSLYLLENCNRLYMPRALTETQRSKEDAFFRFLQREEYDEIAQQFEIVDMEKGRYVNNSICYENGE